MLLIDERIRSVLQECEGKIKEITKNDSLSVLVFSKKLELKLSFDDVIELVCGVTGESGQGVMQKCQKKELVTTRRLIMYYSFHYCRISKAEIARRFKQNHTTILTGIRNVDDMIETGDQLICNYVNEINNIINTIITKQ